MYDLQLMVRVGPIEHYFARHPTDEINKQWCLAVFVKAKILFALRQKDPLEYTNLIHDPAYAEVAEELRRKVENWMTSTDDPILKGPVDGTESAKWAEEALHGRVYVPRNGGKQ